MNKNHPCTAAPLHPCCWVSSGACEAPLHRRLLWFRSRGILVYEQGSRERRFPDCGIGRPTKFDQHYYFDPRAVQFSPIAGNFTAKYAKIAKIFINSLRPLRSWRFKKIMPRLRACFLKTAEVFCEIFSSEFASIMTLTYS